MFRSFEYLGEVPLAPCKAHACPAASFSFLEPFQCCVPLTAPSPACCLRPHRTSPWGEILGRASRPERPRGRTDHPDRAGPPDPCSTTRPRAWTALPPFINKKQFPLWAPGGRTDLLKIDCIRGKRSNLTPVTPRRRHSATRTRHSLLRLR